MSTIRFNLNGQPASVEDDGELTLLAALRDRLGIISPKDGCSPQGKCGCCTVFINGKPLMSCLQKASRMEGKDIVTLEGVEPRKREVLARAFVQVAGLQCGYCIPGIAAKTAALLDKDPNISEAKIRKGLHANLCRCTGYVKIIDAVKVAAEHWTGDTLPPLPEDESVGASSARYQGRERVLGEQPYVDDMTVPEMLYGAVRLSDHPRARVVKIDATQAKAMPGVHAVIGAADVPGAAKVGLIVKDWPAFIAEGQVTHCVGSIIAAVAADTREQARAAAAAIDITYEVLEPVTSPQAAMADDAPQVHADRSNLLSTCAFGRGDVDAAIEASAHVLTESFHTQRIEHAFLEPEACLVVPEDDGGVRVYTQSQGVHDDQKQIASLLGKELEDVRVELVPNGGGFGGKEDLSIQGHTALLAHHIGRPVKLTITRDQSIRVHPKRHPISMTYTMACDEAGHLTAIKAYFIGDTGAYASVGMKVLERAAGHSCGPYRVPNVDILAHTVYTNNVPCGAFRGFGANQAAFGLEGMLDRLADKVGIDGYDMRERNILKPGERFATGQLMNESLGIRQTLEAVKEVYKSSRYAGIACGIKNTGIGNGMPDIGRALIKIDSAEHVTVYTGYTEMGQGLFTIVGQVVAQETGLRLSQISVVTSTDYAVECGMTTASRATVLAGEATRRASVKLKARLDGGVTLGDIVNEEFPGEYICDFTTKPGADVENPITHMTFGYATQVAILDDEGKLAKVVAAHDVGKIMNYALCEGQVHGALHMGIGYALTEDLPCENGWPVSTDLNDLRIIRARDVPELEVKLLEVPDTLGAAYGAKGVGEIGLVPTAPAVAAALHAFDGIRRTQLPMRGSAAARAILPRKMHEPDHA